MTEELGTIPEDNTEVEVEVENKAETETEVKEPEQPHAEKVEEPFDVEKFKEGSQKRMNQLTAQKYQERAAREKAEQDLQEALNKLKQYEGNKDDAPKEEDFDSVEDYLVAKGKWEGKQEVLQAEAEKRKKELEEKQSQLIAKRRKVFEEKEAAIRAEVPDYDEKIEIVNDFLAGVNPKSQAFNVFSEITLASEDSPALLYHLGNNPDLVESIKGMNILDMARTLFVEEYKLKNAPKPKQPKPLPKPPNPVGQTGKKGQKSLSQMSAKELLEAVK